MKQETRELLIDVSPYDVDHDMYDNSVILYDYLLDKELFTNEELMLITNINGLSVETLNDCLFARYGYRDIEQFLESEGV